MATLSDHLIKLTDHRDRDLLELTLAKALVDLLPVDQVIISRVIGEEGVRRWLDVATLDARGGGKVGDRMRVEFEDLQHFEDHRERHQCVQSNSLVEFAWAGENGPRISFISLFSDGRSDDAGVIEIHSGRSLTEHDLTIVHALRHVFGSMHLLLAYSDRDALTGLFNRKSLDDTYYSVVLEEMDNKLLESEKGKPDAVPGLPERRHRVPPNYWLGTVSVDGFGKINDKNGHLLGEEILILVARVLSNTFRNHDRLYRFGGRQFGVLMHCPDEGLVLSAFERFRLNVVKFSFPQVGSVTISAGFTRVTADDSPDTTLDRAERAVAHVQTLGGNRVASYADLIRSGDLDETSRVGDVKLFS